MKKIPVLLPALLILAECLVAQCSDAGICLIGAKRSAVSHRIGAHYLFGRSAKEDDLTFHTVQLEALVQLSRDAGISVAMPWTAVRGSLGSTSGPGDATLLLGYAAWSGSRSTLTLNAGAKLATGSANAGGLPQKYQPGLGTNDLMLGAAYESDPFLFALGYQISRGRSDNERTRLRRGDDIFLRAGYAFAFDPLQSRLELLLIKRMEESSVLQSRIEGVESFVNFRGSDQLQVNILGNALLPLSDDVSLDLQLAVPLLNREVNLDGLTRSISLSVGLEVEI